MQYSELNSEIRLLCAVIEQALKDLRKIQYVSDGRNTFERDELHRFFFGVTKEGTGCLEEITDFLKLDPQVIRDKAHSILKENV